MVSITDFPALCINLKRREDRRIHAEKEAKKLGINIEFMEAVDGKECQVKANKPPKTFSYLTQNQVACLLSHGNVYREAKKRQYPAVLLLEDDFVVPDPDAINTYLDLVPSNWDMIYFSANHVAQPIAIDDKVCKLRGSFTAHMIIVRENLYDTILSMYDKINIPNDFVLKLLHPVYNCYCSIKPLAYQLDGYSDIDEKEAIYNMLKCV